MKKVLVVCSGLYNAGGLGKIVCSFTNELSERNYKVTLLIIDENTSLFYTFNPRIAIDTIIADFGIGRRGTYLQRKFNFIRDLFRYWKKVHEIDPDVIITTEYTFTVANVLNFILKRRKVIAWQHNDFNERKSRIWSLLTKYSYTKVNAIVALNKEDCVLYKRLNNNSFLIPNFIEKAGQQSRLQEKTILTIARLVEEKGIDLLLKTAKIIFKKHPDWKWKLIGAGPLESETQGQIVINNLSHKLLLYSPVSADLTTQYISSSIYVLSSRVESFGMVLIEAMNHGVPCVAFDCDHGPKHIITDGEDGLLVEKENPYKLAEAINYLIENENIRKQMGINAKKKVERFSSDVILKKWDELFNKL